MKLLMLDIDDTLVKTNADMIGVWKRYPDGTEKRLSTSEFALDPDSADGGKSANVVYDYREFGNKEKVTQSIINGIPLVKNLRILDDCLRQGYEVAFLTARANEEMVYEVLSDWLKTKVGDTYLPVTLNKKFCFAINDPKYIDDKTGECSLGKTDAEKKARVLRFVCSKASIVKFVDDDKKNLKNARALGIPNLRVITAWEEGVQMKKNKVNESMTESKLNESIKKQYESIKKQMDKKLNEDAYDNDCHQYLEALQNGLESGFDLVSYFDKNGMRLNIETDCGDFDVEYVPGEWVYVIHFSGINKEFTETPEHTDEAVNLIGWTVEEESRKVAGEFGCMDDYDPDEIFGNEDHSIDFDDEDSPYYLGGGKGW